MALRVDVLLKVFLVPVKVLRAGQRVLQQDEDGQEHLGGHLSIDALELLEVDPALGAEALIDQILDLSLILQAVKEHLANRIKQAKVKLARGEICNSRVLSSH